MSTPKRPRAIWLPIRINFADLVNSAAKSYSKPIAISTLLVSGRRRIILPPYRQGHGRPGQQPARYRHRPAPIRQPASVRHYYGGRRIICPRTPPGFLLVQHHCQGGRLCRAIRLLPGPRPYRPGNRYSRGLPGLGNSHELRGGSTGSGERQRQLAHGQRLCFHVCRRRLHAHDAPWPTCHCRWWLFRKLVFSEYLLAAQRRQTLYYIAHQP